MIVLSRAAEQMLRRIVAGKAPGGGKGADAHWRSLLRAKFVRMDGQHLRVTGSGEEWLRARDTRPCRPLGGGDDASMCAYGVQDTSYEDGWRCRQLAMYRCEHEGRDGSKWEADYCTAHAKHMGFKIPADGDAG